VNAAGGRFDDATLATLEFSDVKEQIAAHSTCEPGAAALRSLRPDRERSEARADLALVDDAVAFFDAGGDFGFADVVDVADSLERAEVGGVLSGSELRDVARSERALAQAAAAIHSHYKTDVVGRAQLGGGAVDLHGRPPRPLLALASDRRQTDPLIRRLETAIDADGMVADAASSELARVRRQQRSLTEEIRRRVDDIVKKPNTAKLLSEEIVTVRGGRFVVPVRTEFAAQFPGVVHAQSASGATVFIEPMACVEANNRLRGLEAAEEREINRVLAELSALVAKDAEAVSANAGLLAALDSIGARARWALRKGALSPVLVDTQSVRIVHGRHPLLRREAVPLDVSVGIDAEAVIISGPNMGGKTVVLKTIGLFCLLAYAGIPLPAGPGTEIGSFDHIACVVGDDQSIANDLSSFSAHLRALHGALERAGPRSIVLVDEIGNGTEPGAGAALAQAFIEGLLGVGARVVVTTHFTQLKIFAASRERVANASMLFDAQTHEPTYVLAMGVPGQSLAFALARTIGLDPRAIARAEELLGSDAQNLERAFEGLATEREHLRSQAAEVDRELQRLRAVETELRDRIAAAQADRSIFEKDAAAALDRAVRDVREELLAKAERSEQDSRRQRARPVEVADEALRKTMTDIRRSLGLDRTSDAEPAPNAYAVGDRVYVRSFGQPGVVSEVYDRDVLVTIGNVKAVVSRKDLTRDPAATSEAAAKASRGATAREGGPQRLASLDASTSIDVRGMRVDEAMQIVDKALDDASLAGLAVLRIIHGKGTGQLGRGIRDSLKGHTQVAGLESAPDREGGTGVTVVTLR
jgi:DNA mismatch repair protein MutS2